MSFHNNNQPLLLQS